MPNHKYDWSRLESDFKRLGSAHAIANEYGCDAKTVYHQLAKKGFYKQQKTVRQTQGKKRITTRTEEERYVFSLLISTMLRLCDNVPIAPPDMVIDYAIEDVKLQLCGIDTGATVIYNKQKRVSSLAKKKFMQ